MGSWSFGISMDSVLSDPALEPSYSTYWTQWAGAIIGACLVGLTGVLPLWVIPAKALGTARSAPTEDNLKYLLAFAVGGLLGEEEDCSGLEWPPSLGFLPFLSSR